MAKSIKLKKLVTTTNTCFYGFSESRQKLIEKTRQQRNNEAGKKANDAYSKELAIKAINSNCGEIAKTNSFATLQNSEKYFHIALSDYSRLKRTEQEDKLIYRIENFNGEYTIATGLYCGIVNLGSGLPQIEIQTGYSERLTKRMLNFCCGIYVDIENSESEANESLYSLLIQYLFLMSLRKVASKTIPKKYVYPQDRGYNINGNIDIDAYISSDLLSYDKKVTFRYPKQLEIQSIVDVLYAAIKQCRISRNDALPNLMNFESYLKGLSSGKRPSQKMISGIQKEKCLTNSLYSDFKTPLRYAQILLRHDDLDSGTDKSVSSVSGFLVDSSFLWEMYLYNLMTIYLPDWSIDAQCEIAFYSDTFFPKKNYPDFVARNRNTGDIYILDAKFKRMTFDNNDVDNEDIRQLHAYSYYFHLSEGEKFKGAALIYPTTSDRPESKNNTVSMFGLSNPTEKFGVLTLQDPGDSGAKNDLQNKSEEETLSRNEVKFIQELKEFFGNSH